MRRQINASSRYHQSQLVVNSLQTRPAKRAVSVAVALLKSSLASRAEPARKDALVMRRWMNRG